VSGPVAPSGLSVADSDWIEWFGGECPVENGTTVEIDLRCGETLTGLATEFDWRHIADDARRDIVAYRVVSLRSAAEAACGDAA